MARSFTGEPHHPGSGAMSWCRDVERWCQERAAGRCQISGPRRDTRRYSIEIPRLSFGDRHQEVVAEQAAGMRRHRVSLLQWRGSRLLGSTVTPYPKNDIPAPRMEAWLQYCRAPRNRLVRFG